MDRKRNWEGEELGRRMLEEQQADDDPQQREQLRLPAREPGEFHRVPPVQFVAAVYACSLASAACCAACAESSASAARERMIMSTQSWNARASTATRPFSGPSFKHPLSSKLSSVTWPR